MSEVISDAAAVLCTVVEHHALAAGHKPFEKEADKDGLGAAPDRLAFD